jgi:hypothetical protein
MGFSKSGVNLSWEKGRKYLHYGYDIGLADPNKSYHIGFSNPQSKERLYKAFETLTTAHVKSVRVFLFCDFRAGIHFDNNRQPYFDEKVYEDSDALMESTRTYGLELIPVLLDFYVANKWFLNFFDPFDHPEIFKDDPIRNELIKLFCQYIRHYSEKYKDVLQAWDLFNEPEWAWAISFKTILSQNDPRAVYIKEMYKAGNKNSLDIPITVGWNKKENAINFIDFTDIIQAHCYNENFLNFLNFLLQKSSGKKILIGEAGAKTLNHMEYIMKIAREKDTEVLFWDSPEGGYHKYIFDHNKFKDYMSAIPQG